MAAKCYICKVYDPKKMSLFRIPNRNDEYSERGRMWLKLLDEKKENIQKIRICSAHFINKKPSKADDHLNIDWIPNKNLGLYSKNWKRVERYFQKKKNSPEENLNNLNEESKSIDDVVLTNVVSLTNGDFKLNKYNNVGASCSSKNVEPITESNFNLSKNQAAVPRFDSRTKQALSDFETSKPVYGRDFDLSKKVAGCVSSVIGLKKRKIDVHEVQTFFVKDIQTELTMNDIDLLFENYQKAVDGRDELLLKLSGFVICEKFFMHNDKKTRFYTGLTNWKLLSRFYNLVKDSLPSHPNCKLSQFQMLALTLMKLRLNLSFTDLGYRFQIDVSTASRYFHRCLFILFKKFKNSKMIHWPKRMNLLLNTPSYFRCFLKETVTVIIDCFELFIERSSMLRAAAQSFSKYKSHTTLKYLIGISITGAIIFISEAFGGRTSDKEATILSGFLENLEEGDLVLADKGFLIADEVKARNASLMMPSFVKKGAQLHPTDIECSRKLSSYRIHVERVINILRQKFSVCADIAEMSAVSKCDELFDKDKYDQIVFVCSCIVNMCPSVVTNDFEI